MKLKVKKKKVALKEAPPTRGRNEGNEEFQKLSDTYDKPEIPEQKILVTSFKNKDMEDIKTYIVAKVQRFDDTDKMGLPYVFIQMYRESPRYTGYLKGKSVYLPLEMLYDFIDMMTELSDKCDKLKIE